MAQGLNNHQACLLIGVNPTTGMRWSKGRNMVDHPGKVRYYPPIHAEPVAISPRYLSEEERILIGDLLTAGHSQRSVAWGRRCLVEAIGRIGSQAALGGSLTALSMLMKERSRREWAGRRKLNSQAEKEVGERVR